VVFEKEGLARAGDFLDTIDDDKPKGKGGEAAAYNAAVGARCDTSGQFRSRALSGPSGAPQL
jgi:hypothetical protein